MVGIQVAVLGARASAAGPLVLAVSDGGCRASPAGACPHRRVLLATGLLGAWLLSTPAVAEALIGWVESFAPEPLSAEALARRLRGPSPPGAIVVLGAGAPQRAGMAAARMPNPRTLERLASCAAGTRERPADLVSGGTPRRRETSEAALMARTLSDSSASRRAGSTIGRGHRRNARNPRAYWQPTACGASCW